MSELGRQVLAVGGSGVRIEVSGRPRTKGSLEPVHVRVAPGKCRVTLKESGEYSEPWKKEMIRAIKAQCVVKRFDGAVVVDTFSRFERLCAPDHRMPWPTRQEGTFAHGDEDKLRRNALDALTQSGLIADDSNVVFGVTAKRWAEAGETCGILIKVRPATIDDIDLIRRLEMAP